MICFGRVIEKTDKRGNAMVNPGGKARLVVLVRSTDLRFSSGTLVEYINYDGFQCGERVDFVNCYSSTDFAFYDNVTRNLLVVRRESPDFSVSENFHLRTRELWKMTETIEGTSPRVECYAASDFDLDGIKHAGGLKELLGFPEIGLIRGIFPGQKVKSLLEVPAPFESDRDALERLLQKNLDTILKPL